jgi:hypothetical protein
MSKKTMALLCILTGSIGLVIGCSKASEDKLTTPSSSPCDTVNMTFSTDIQPILQANCYRCHGNGIVNGGVTLDTYAGLKIVAEGAGYPPMPDDGGKLSDCDINKIKDWINRGASNN